MELSETVGETHEECNAPSQSKIVHVILCDTIGRIWQNAGKIVHDPYHGV